MLQYPISMTQPPPNSTRPHDAFGLGLKARDVNDRATLVLVVELHSTRPGPRPRRRAGLLVSRGAKPGTHPLHQGPCRPSDVLSCLRLQASLRAEEADIELRANPKPSSASGFAPGQSLAVRRVVAARFRIKPRLVEASSRAILPAKVALLARQNSRRGEARPRKVIVA